MLDRPLRSEPVRLIPGDEGRAPEEGIAVCLSGGGFRAMLFHAGSLWRLSDLGLLGDVARFSSVSGGSITAGLLALRWPVAAADFERRIVAPLCDLAGRHIDIPASLTGAVLPGQSIPERAAKVYDEHLFEGATLQDLPDDPPRFVFCATNLATGVLWRFSKPFMGDYRVGRVMRPTVKLATAVAASAAFPPPLSPLRLDLPATGWNLDEADLGDEYRKTAVLSDGGVYDNLGLETAWKRYRTVLVSDGGGHFEPDPAPSHNTLLQMPRVLKVIDGQVRALRRAQIVGSIEEGTRTGAYWSMLPNDTPAADPLPVDHDRARALAAIPTRLDKLDEDTRRELVNWGYASADAAVRGYYREDLPKPGGFPYPGGVG
jgi:NTE family protein